MKKFLISLFFVSFFFVLFAATEKEDFTVDSSPSPSVKEKVSAKLLVQHLYQLNVVLARIVSLVGSVLTQSLISIKQLLESDKSSVLVKSSVNRAEHMKKLKKVLDAAAVFEKELHAYYAA